MREKSRLAQKPHASWRRKLALKVLVVSALIAFLQFLYPADRTLPNAQIGQVSVGGLERTEVVTRLNTAYKTWSRTIVAQQHEYAVSSDDIGLTLDAEQTFSGPLAYPWWQRLIPGSFVWRVVSGQTVPALSINSDKLRDFTKKIHDENYKPAVNATIAINGDQASMVSEADGFKYPPVVTAMALGNDFFASTNKLQLKETRLTPAVTARNSRSTLDQAQKLLKAPPTYTFDGANSAVSGATLGSWLEFTANEKDRKLVMGFGLAKLQNFLASLQPYAYTVPASTVAAVDGQDITVLPGNDQKAIDVAAAITNTRGILQHIGSAQTVVIPQIELTAGLKANRSYSKSQLGLQALVRDLAAEKGGYGIALQELGARGWSASANGDKKFITASTYKLFVAYAVLKNIESGTWTWGGRMSGESVKDCFDDMIVYSDNACAEAFGQTIGWANIQAQMRDLGLSNTSLSGEFTSTTNDELTFMTKLGRGEILNQESRNALLGAMKRQVYRSGIPAGVGVAVADKVGFLNGLLHDAAIVYAPQGDYALVILTSGSSWGNISDTAARIQKQLE